MSIEVPCAQCGTKLKRYPSNLKAAKYGSFCNRDCLGLYRSAVLVGDWAANYKRGLTIEKGYQCVQAWWHPDHDDTGYVYLHRLLAEAKIGRFLTNKEVVHHIDHNNKNNHWDNLEITTQSEHARKHIKKRKRGKDGRI